MFGCFLSYVTICFIANDVVLCRYFDDVDGFVGRDVCNGILIASGEVSVGVVQHIRGVVELFLDL